MFSGMVSITRKIRQSGEEASVDAIATVYDKQGMTPIERSVSMSAISNVGGTTPHSRAGSQ